MKERIKFVGQALNHRGRNTGPEDGLMGNKTLKALGPTLAQLLESGDSATCAQVNPNFKFVSA